MDKEPTQAEKQNKKNLNFLKKIAQGDYESRRTSGRGEGLLKMPQGKVKSACEPSGPSGRSLSRFL